MARSLGKNLQDNLNIEKQTIHNLALLLCSNMNRSCLDIAHVIRARIDSSQDYVLQADLSWHQIPSGCLQHDLFPNQVGAKMGKSTRPVWSSNVLSRCLSCPKKAHKIVL